MKTNKIAETIFTLTAFMYLTTGALYAASIKDATTEAHILIALGLFGGLISLGFAQHSRHMRKYHAEN